MADNLKITTGNVDTAINPSAGVGEIKAQDHNNLLKEILAKVGKFTGSPFLAQSDTNSGVVPVGVLVWNNNAFNNTTAFELTVAKKTADLNDIGIILGVINSGSLIHFKDFVGRSCFLEYVSHVAATDTGGGAIYRITVKGDADNSNYAYQAAEQEPCVIEFFNKASGSDLKSIEIEGNVFQWQPSPLNTTSTPLIGDRASNGWIEYTDATNNRFGVSLVLHAADYTLFTSWTIEKEK